MQVRGPIDHTRDPGFGALLSATETITGVLAASNVGDARRLAQRSVGWHNLQGHARAVVPLAVWLARLHPELLCNIRDMTNLGTNMSNTSQEARGAFWDDVKAVLRASLQQYGNDLIAVGLRTTSPETAQEIAHTYISADYGGGQTSGGAGTTVLKRTLKLLAHTLPLDCN